MLCRFALLAHIDLVTCNSCGVLTSRINKGKETRKSREQILGLYKYCKLNHASLGAVEIKVKRHRRRDENSSHRVGKYKQDKCEDKCIRSAYLGEHKSQPVS